MCLLNFAEGDPTELNSNLTLHVSYDSHQKSELLSPVEVTHQIKYRQSQDFILSFSKRRQSQTKKTANHVITAAGLSNIPVKATEKTQKFQNDHLQRENKAEKVLD